MSQKRRTKAKIDVTNSKNNKGKITLFLEKYKIWFETIMCVVLSICAIIVSIQANKISENQYNYEVNKNQEHFVINRYYNDDLEIEYVLNNTGGDLKECDVFIDHYISLKLNNHIQRFLISKLDSNNTEEYMKNSDFLPFYFQFPKLSNNKTIDSCIYDYIELMNYNNIEVKLISYVMIYYTDINNEKKEKYFCICDNDFFVEEVEKYYNLSDFYEKSIKISILDPEEFESYIQYYISEFYEEYNK